MDGGFKMYLQKHELNIGTTYWIFFEFSTKLVAANNLK